MRHTMARSTTVPAGQGFGYSLKIDCTTADTNLGTDGIIILTQKIEAQNLIRIKKGTASAEKLTYSFWVRSNLSGASNLLTCVLYDDDNSRSASATVQIDSADTWQRASVTFPADTSGALNNDNGAGFYVQIYMGVGSQFTSGTMNTAWASYSNANVASSNTMNLASSTDNEILFTGFQLEQGSAATDFEFEPYDMVLQKCKRYLLSFTAASNYARFAIGQAFGTGGDDVLFEFKFHPEMRSTPTLSTGTLSDLAVTDNDADLTARAIDSALSIDTNTDGPQGTNVLAPDINGNPMATGAMSFLIANNNTNAVLNFDAEL